MLSKKIAYKKHTKKEGDKNEKQTKNAYVSKLRQEAISNCRQLQKRLYDLRRVWVSLLFNIEDDGCMKISLRPTDYNSSAKDIAGSASVNQAGI